jgi:hypothetical protein
MVPANGGEAVQVTKGSGPDIGVRAAADARRVLFLERRQINYLWSAGLDGSNARQLTFDDQQLSGPMVSPDNNHISFSANSSDLFQLGSHVYTVQSDGANRTQLTVGNDLNQYATWSPDGRHIAYSTLRIGEPWDSSRVYLIEASNPGTPKLAGRGIAAWWIDSERFILIFAMPHLHTSFCSVLNAEPTEVSPDSTGYFPLRDGKQTLVWDFRKGKEGWWLRSGGAEQGAVSKQILSSHVWSAWPTVSMRYLVYRNANGELWRMSLPGGKQERLPDIFRGLSPNPSAMQIGFSYDDKHVVYTKGRLDARLVLIENPLE